MSLKRTGCVYCQISSRLALEARKESQEEYAEVPLVSIWLKRIQELQQETYPRYAEIKDHFDHVRLIASIFFTPVCS